MNSSTWLALIALPEPLLPEPSLVQSALSEGRLQLATQTDALVLFNWNEATVAYTLVDKPIPAEQLAGPCERAWYWPEAAERLAGHRAHLLVALVDEGRDRVAKSLRLTQFVAALLSAAGAGGSGSGVQWGGSRQVHEPSAFVEVAATSSKENLPLHLWIDFQVEATEVNALRLYTTGLAAFGRPEMEVAHYAGTPQELMNHAYNLAHYVLERGGVIKEGEKIGLPGEIQVTAYEATTFLDGDDNVLRFDFEEE